MRSEIDKSNMYDLIEKQNEQIRTAWDSCPDFSFKCTKVVFCGMGGSAIAGDIAAELVDSVPFIVSRKYIAPGIIDKKTLVIVNSYSGNTEETLSAYKEAVEKKAKILCLASGGQLAGMAKENGHPLVNLPKGMQPRVSIMFSLISIVKILGKNGLIENAEEMVEEAAALLSDKTIRDKGEQLAETLKGKVPLIYTDEPLKPVAYRWKTQVNENVKWPAFFHTFSEMNHNEILQFQNLPAYFAVIYLRDSKEHSQIKKRFEICKNIIKCQLEEVHSKGTSKLARMCYLINLGDWYSYYLALLHNIDPTPVEVIENLKKQL